MSDDWLSGQPMDPSAASVEPLPAIPGFPFLHAGSCAVIVGPTGGGRSSLVQAALYDAARAGVRCAYLGSEVTHSEFNARAALLAERRCDRVDDELREQLAGVRYLDLADTISHAWKHPSEWIAAMSGRYDLLVIDPISAVASALGLDFDKANSEYVDFHGRLIQPIVTAGVTVPMLDNVGHDPGAKGRAKGASAKSDRADLTFSCAISTTPPGLLVKADKVRSIRAAFTRGDEWLFVKDTQRIEARHRPDSATSFRPTHQMQAVSEALETTPGLSKRAIRATVGGKAGYVDLALDLLVSEGFVTVERGAGGHAHSSVTPYRQPTVSTVSDPCPQACPDTGSKDRVPVSPPLKGGHGHGHDNGHSNGAHRVPTDTDLEALFGDTTTGTST